MAGWSWGDKHIESGGGGLLRQSALLCARLIEDESDRWFLWVPVFFGAGIGLYFSLSVEPPIYYVITALCITLSLSFATRRIQFIWTLMVASFLASLGFADAKLRAFSVAQPALERSGGFKVFKGWIEKTEARLPRGHRITLRPIEASKNETDIPAIPNTLHQPL